MFTAEATPTAPLDATAEFRRKVLAALLLAEQDEDLTARLLDQAFCELAVGVA